METSKTPLSNLAYFSEWGGNGWNGLISGAFTDFIGTDLRGKRVLEIGSRYGKMSCLFALLGAEVVGVDVVESTIADAEAEAKKWNVSHLTRFVAYDGDLDSLKMGQFDLIFTKSVLVVVPDLAKTLFDINGLLQDGGKFVFIENGKGNSLLHFLRSYRHRNWDFRDTNYFTQSQLDLIKHHLDVRHIRQSFLPPIYSIMGYKKNSQNPQ